MNHEALTEILTSLRLTTVTANLLTVSMEAEKRKLSYEQFLAELLQAEVLERANQRKKMLLKQSKITKDKALETFRYQEREGVSEKQIQRLATGDWVKSGKNLVLYGEIGVGKSHLSEGLIRALCARGFRCLFITTAKLIEDLKRAKQNLDLSPMFKRLDKFDLLVCDELGFIPQNQEGGELFFQLISHRYERKSILITTNLPYSEWVTVFHNKITTAAAVDRIIHHCETLNIMGTSGRLEAAKQTPQS